MRRLAVVGALCVTFAFTGLIDCASAQSDSKKKRPFEDYSRRPSVSPYMNLTNNNTGTATNYQSLVRPQLEQQAFNRRSLAAINQLQGQAANSTKSQTKTNGTQKAPASTHAATQSSSKKKRPLEDYSRRPSVSPYMNLTNNNTGTATNYQSLVRPQLDQQTFNRQSSSAINQLQGQVGSATKSQTQTNGTQKAPASRHVATQSNSTKKGPLEDYPRTPSVSPYMNLTNNNTGTATNYQSLGRPQLDPQAFNRQSSSGINQVSGKSSSAAKSPTQTNGNQKARASKHAATRDNYSRYFPGAKQ
jgi:hypothetical protein